MCDIFILQSFYDLCGTIKIMSLSILQHKKIKWKECDSVIGFEINSFIFDAYNLSSPLHYFPFPSSMLSVVKRILNEFSPFSFSNPLYKYSSAYYTDDGSPIELVFWILEEQQETHK